MATLSGVDFTTLSFSPDTLVQPRVLAGLVGKDVTQIYAWAQDGRLPRPIGEATYREAFTRLIDSLIKQEELKKVKFEENLRLRQEQQERKEETKSSNTTKFTDFTDDGDMHPLMADKIRMAIRKDHATTIATLQKVAIERGEYTSSLELEELLKPFLLTIRDMLDVIVSDFPETEDKIFILRENLYQLGLHLIDKSTIDRDTLVQSILEIPTEDLTGKL